MNILVENGTYDCHNAGDLTMLSVCVERLFEHFPSANIFIATQSPTKLKKLIPKATPITLLSGKLVYSQHRNLFRGLHKLIPLPSHYVDDFEKIIKLNFPRFSRYFIKKFTSNLDNREKLDNYFSFLDSIDIAVVSGGGFITDDFESHAVKLLETVHYISRKGKPIAFFGQGIGPITHKELKKIAGRVLSKSTLITLREELEGPSFLDEFGISSQQYRVTGDDAISYVTKSTPTPLGSAIGFNIRSASYAGVSSDTSNKITKLVCNFSAKQETSILPTPISWHQDENDLDNILKLLNSSRDENSVYLETTEGLRHQTSLCRLVVTGSDLSPKFRAMTLMRFLINYRSWRSQNEKTLQRRTNNPGHKKTRSWCQGGRHLPRNGHIQWHLLQLA